MTEVSEAAATPAAAAAAATTPAATATSAAREAIFNILDRRRSVREFTERPVERSVLERVLNAARGAPSAGNLQAWRVYVRIHDPTRVQRPLCSQEWVNTAPVVLVFCALPRQSGRKYGHRGRHLYSLQDATLAAAHAQIAAEALGLRSCMVGAFYEDEVAAAFGGFDVSEIVPVLLLPMGYPTPAAIQRAATKTRNRRPLSEVAFFA